jgi:hypothetical protein
MRSFTARAACLLVAVALAVATIATTAHGHDRPSAPCASCVFARSSGTHVELPRLPLPVPATLPRALPLRTAAGFTPPPLAFAPKHGPPAAA